MNNVFTAKLLQNLNNKKGNKGFTLIELLVVVIIIGVLAAVALPNLLAQVGKARESEGKLGVGTITRAQQTRHFETGNFEDEDNAGFATIAGNNLGLTATSEYFTFLSDAGNDGTADFTAGTVTGGNATDAALVGVQAAAPTAANASANGTRAFTSEMSFANGNYTTILCQSNLVTNVPPAYGDVDGAAATPTCGTGNTEIR